MPDNIDLEQMTADILEAAQELHTATGKQIARRAGYPADQQFSEILLQLESAGRLKHEGETWVYVPRAEPK